jgi:hypothetical protein
MQPWRDRNLGLGRESNTDPGSTSSSLLPSPGFDYQNLGIKYIVKDAAEWKHLGKQFGKQDSTTLRADLHEGATPTTPQIGRRWRQPASQKGPQIKPHVSFEQVSVETMKGMRLCFNTTSTLETVMMLINRKSSQRETAQSRYAIKRAMGITTVVGDGYKEFLRDQHLIYITGAGGTGKTTLISSFLLGMEVLDRVREVLILAPTGSAACHVGGQTIHAAFGVSRDTSGNSKKPANPPNLKPYQH